MVEVPSSSALTTRCPIMLQMRRSQEQVVTVGICWHDRCVIASCCGCFQQTLTFTTPRLWRMRKKVNPDSTRTIPITKPDLIDKGGKLEKR